MNLHRICFKRWRSVVAAAGATAAAGLTQHDFSSAMNAVWIDRRTNDRQTTAEGLDRTPGKRGIRYGFTRLIAFWCHVPY